MIELEILSITDSQTFVQYGSYDCDYSRTVWELANIPIEDKGEKGVVNVKINGFKMSQKNWDEVI